MKIVLVIGHATDHPDVATLRAKLVAVGVPYSDSPDRPSGNIAFLPCIAALYTNGVAAKCFGTGATDQQITDAGAANGEPPADQPNNPGNPYFGKAPKTPKDFWGFMMGVYIALAPGATAAEKQKSGLARLGRVTTSPTASSIVMVANGVALIDPDDKSGDFLKMVGLLTTTQHEDGELLMEEAELAAAMAAWI